MPHSLDLSRDLPGHSIPVGYLKGGIYNSWTKLGVQYRKYGRHCEWVHCTSSLSSYIESNNKLSIIIILGEGSQLDYTVNTLRMRALANGKVATIVLTFCMDSIAQESNETFALILDPLVSPNPREGLYFQNIAQITIIDSDGKLLDSRSVWEHLGSPDSSLPHLLQLLDHHLVHQHS